MIIFTGLAERRTGLALPEPSITLEEIAAFLALPAGPCFFIPLAKSRASGYQLDIGQPPNSIKQKTAEDNSDFVCSQGLVDSDSIFLHFDMLPIACYVHVLGVGTRSGLVGDLKHLQSQGVVSNLDH